MMCTTDHTFAHPRDCLDHLMSVNVTARLKVLRGGVSLLFYPDPFHAT